ncbi:uncharacterized protein [Physcomitrium patens]|uniref:Peptidoglycan binding-like domain-containing protein n=2 Tax=Physcomitrium patens TaxID=3218 RepID=A0A7I3ZAI0_PHYPA|nr:protein disulfide isomerase pTAC5, chloroplastic-like [Physcomitrium patens]|eukprot:XP_024403682.1 protein disulfide isomerase pTAC5, chloroplastic-like [Physcomitrella patens]
MESQTAMQLSSLRSWPALPQHQPVVLLSCRPTPFHFSDPGLRSRPSFRLSASLNEEDRWLREEQRWLREEQRWLREEARWLAERRLMADELDLLKRELEQLRAQVQERREFSTGTATLPSVIANLKQLIQSLPPEPRPNIEFMEELEELEELEEFESPVSISDRSSSSLKYGSTGNTSSNFSSSPSIPSMSEFSIDLISEVAPAKVATAQTEVMLREMRKGAEGDEVKELQEALQELGFYSGEEDIEYSMFADGTETAVKTWQASIGVREDGVLSPELLAMLLSKTQTNAKSSKEVPSRQSVSNSQKATGATSTGSNTGTKRSFAEEKRDIENTRDENIASNRRVFLLGENRWEEPSSLRKPKTNGASSVSPRAGQKAVHTEKCFSCKGEGVTMCSECEGTGELNVEDQFLDWVEEGAKCPYCEGTGAIDCDVCDGAGTTRVA